MLGHGIVGSVSETELNEKGEQRRTIGIVLRSGRQTQTIRAKFRGDLVKAADNLGFGDAVTFLGTLETGQFNGRDWHAVRVVALERITRPEAA